MYTELAIIGLAWYVVTYEEWNYPATRRHQYSSADN